MSGRASAGQREGLVGDVVIAAWQAGLRMTPGAVFTTGVALALLYEKVNHTVSAFLRAPVRGSTERRGPVMTAVSRGKGCLSGWQARVLDGNYLATSEKRLTLLGGSERGDAGAVLGCLRSRHGPSHRTCWPARTRAMIPLDGAAPGQMWIANRHFCQNFSAFFGLGSTRHHRIAAISQCRTYFMSHGSELVIAGLLTKRAEIEGDIAEMERDICGPFPGHAN